MLYSKYLLFQCIILLSIHNFGLCDEDTDVDKAGVEVLQHLIYSTYKADKLKLITKFMENAYKEGDPDNYTLVGTQEILNPDGSVKEVRAVALHLPSTKPSKSLQDPSDTGDSEGHYDELKDTFTKYSNIGLPIEVAYEQKDKHGNLEESIFINKDITYHYTEGIGYLNKTKHTDRATAKAKIEALKAITKIPLTVLIYDSTGKFVKDKSVIPDQNPIVFIDDIEVQPEISFNLLIKLIKLIIRILGYIFATHDDMDIQQIADELAAALTEQAPEFDFFIIPGNTDATHVKSDIYIKANYALVETDEGIPINIYAIQKK